MHRVIVFFFSFRGIKRILRFGWKTFRYIALSITGGKNINEQLYDKWLRKNMPKENDFKAYSESISSFELYPLISVVLPVHNAELNHLKAAVESVELQIYDSYELCLAYDGSTNADVRNYIENIGSLNPKVKVLSSKDSNSVVLCANEALSSATGEFITFLNQEDLLTKDALYQFVKRLNQEQELDLAYTDEDQFTDIGSYFSPYFKPEYSPDNLMSRNYFGHLVFVRKTLMDQLENFRLDFEGSHQYDLWLRATEKAKGVVRIPKLLYHHRNRDHSINETYKESGKRALEDAISRRKLDAIVEHEGEIPGVFRILYKIEGRPKVSIIIPTKDNAEVLDICLKSIFNLTAYKNFEVILVNNNSENPETFTLFDKYKNQEPDRFKVLDQTYSFNFSKLMNAAVEISEGKFLLLLNNDTEVLQSNWIERMLGQAQRPEIGVVGVKLLYPNNTIQHAGVVIGLGGIAGHSFVAAKREATGYHNYLASVTNYSALTAACLMVNKAKYMEVNGFDEDLAVEYNDVDFCLKLIELGYYNVYIPDVELYHYESLTRGHPHANRKSYSRHKKEVQLFVDRWQSYINHDPFYNPNLTRIHTHFEPNI